jgi:hypothetical protein
MMNYSFIVPRSKRLISGEIRQALFFFSMSIVMIVAAYGFLAYKVYLFKQQHQAFGDTLIELEHSKDELKQKITIIELEVKKSEEIATRNATTKESIYNLFDLVPDSITLTRADLDQNSLILYGETPTKDVYEFMLQAPLRAIFHRTYTSFYPTQNGWYNFVSTNYLEEENLVEEHE